MPVEEIYSGILPETTMLGQLMKSKGFDLDELFIFGLGEAFDFRWKKENNRMFISGKDEGEDIINRVLANQNLQLTIKLISTIDQLKSFVKPRLDEGMVPGIRLHTPVADISFDEDYTYGTILNHTGDELKVLLPGKSIVSMNCRDLHAEIQERGEIYLFMLEGFSRDDYSQENRYLNAIKRCALRYQESGVLQFNRFIDKLRQSDVKQQKIMLEGLKRSLNLDEDLGPMYRRFYRNFLKKTYEVIPAKNIETGIRIISDVIVLWEDVILQIENNWDEEINGELTELLSSISRNELHAMDVLMK